jgi:hypothetical protein
MIYKQVALLIPCYNNKVGLFQSLTSIDEKNLIITVYIVNDGSDFDLKLADFIDFNFKFEIINNIKNLGIEESLRIGVAKINNDNFEFFSRLDCGDTQCINRIYKQVLYLNNHPDVAIVGSYAKAVDPKTTEVVFELRNPTEPKDIKHRLLATCCLCHPTITARTKNVISVGNYRKKYQCAEDYDLYLRLSKKYKLANLPEFLVRYEFAQDESYISIGRRPEQLKSRLKLQVTNFNLFSIFSYYGIGKSIILNIVPYKYIIKFKKKVFS